MRERKRTPFVPVCPTLSVLPGTGALSATQQNSQHVPSSSFYGMDSPFRMRGVFRDSRLRKCPIEHGTAKGRQPIRVDPSPKRFRSNDGQDSESWKLLCGREMGREEERHVRPEEKGESIETFGTTNSGDSCTWESISWTTVTSSEFSARNFFSPADTYGGNQAFGRPLFTLRSYYRLTTLFFFED